MRDNSGGRSLVLIVVFSIFCIFTYSSNLQHYLISSPSKRLFQNTSTAGRNKTLEVNNTDSARNYKTLNLYSFEKTSSNNISLETPWTTINESSLGLHLFSDNIENIRLIGERHSGTTFLVRHLKRCFPGRSVGDFFVAKKHWMQASPEKIISAAKKYGERGLAPTVLENDYDAKTWWQIANAPNPKSVFRASLLLVVFRDPYDWVEAMRKKPWHWPNHVDVRPRNSSVLKSTNYRKQQERGASGRRLRATIYDTPTGESVGGKLPATGSALTFQKEFIKHSLLGWKDFVTRPMHLLDYQEADDKERLCQKGFSFGTICKCIFMLLCKTYRIARTISYF